MVTLNDLISITYRKGTMGGGNTNDLMSNTNKRNITPRMMILMI